MLDKKIIYDISREYDISTSAIGQFLEIILFKNSSEDKNNNLIHYPEKLKIELLNFIKLTRIPQKLYSIRVNNIKKKEKQKNPSKIWGEMIEDPQIPNISYLKVNGPFELKKMDKSITIDRFAAESVMIGANLYIPGFLSPKELYYFKKNQKVSIFGPGHIHVANGLTRINSSDLLKQKKGIGIETLKSKYIMARYRDSEQYERGFISDQNFSSIIACWALMSFYSGDEQILDMCSAPGHKTCCLSEIGYYLTKGSFPNIISVDRSKKRLNSLYEDIPRLKLDNIKIFNVKIQKLKEKHPELIEANDLVVLDPPCSALGTRPKLRIENTWDNYRSLFLLQRSFLKQIDDFIKPGGILLYNTCTMTLLENEGIVWYAIDRLGYKLISAWGCLEKLFPGRFITPSSPSYMKKQNKNNNINDYFGSELNYGIHCEEEINDYLNNEKEHRNEQNCFVFENIEDILKYSALTPDLAKKTIRTYPKKNNNTGYFIALLQKME
ncbi:MAG: hypothetical protein GY870_17790 [archaeon]|nr:hypothetical protein [archaeon]